MCQSLCQAQGIPRRVDRAIIAIEALTVQKNCLKIGVITSPWVEVLGKVSRRKSCLGRILKDE